MLRLITAPDPKLVKLQFQMSAMPTVGDPKMYFTKYPGRFLSMHLQGVDLNAPPPGAAGGQRARGGRGATGLAAGKDSLDWPAIFNAAKTGGVRTTSSSRAGISPFRASII